MRASQVYHSPQVNDLIRQKKHCLNGNYFFHSEKLYIDLYRYCGSDEQCECSYLIKEHLLLREVFGPQLNFQKFGSSIVKGASHLFSFLLTFLEKQLAYITYINSC